jgi:hypothetical protein
MKPTKCKKTIGLGPLAHSQPYIHAVGETPRLPLPPRWRLPEENQRDERGRDLFALLWVPL